MAIITVSQLETALGVTFNEAQQDQAEFYIDTISAYIETYTGVTFTEHVDETLVLQSDYYGEIKLALQPISSISSVTKLGIPAALCPWGWDQYDTIFNLDPHTAYEVVMSFGYSSPPMDIVGYVTQAVILAMTNPTNQASRRVGDVTESYGNVAGGGDVMSYAQLGQQVLDSYKRTNDTWKIGPRAFSVRPTGEGF